ncbi:uncharacterized protein LOC107361492 [Tetranychus urticae]|uniref:uncharacterized protein LOC107361492 n=1 Tax=Tetranychus urticae TaxID=32264 RepID=UPI00077BA53E|nr:uncharacterized protein LOC107361492 [Tetranychus urticae]
MININSLPVEVLHLIFMKLPWVEDYISVSKVCLLWEQIAFQRMSWVKYLIGVYDYNGEPENIGNDILYYRQGVMASYALKYLVPYLPNLRILEIIDPYKMDPETLGTIAKDNRNIKGIRYDRRIPGSIDDCLGDIEMLSTNCVAEAMAPLCSCLKQLYIRYSNERTLAIVSQHLHLERLHIHDFVGENFLQQFEEPFQNLVILELGFKRLDFKSIADLDRVIRMCPKLESLYLRFEDLDRFVVEGDMDNTNNIYLINMVLQYSDEYWPEDPVFPLIYRFLNLKQLAIRDNMGLHDHDIWD